MAEFIPSDNLYPEEVTPVHEEKLPSWVDKFGTSFAVLMVSIALFLGSFGLLLWNEYKTVEEVWRLNEGTRLVVPLASDQPDSDTNGQLIHTSGKVNTDDILSDEVFYISANGVKLARIVEMYQWAEEVGRSTEEGEKDKKALTHVKVWSQKAIDSNKFKQQQGHINPPMELFSSEYIANNVNVGGFALTEPFIVQLNDYQDFPMTADTYAQISPDMQQFKLHGTEFYKGSPDAPEVGDIRVRYKIVKPGKIISVIGMQNLDKIEVYHTDYSAIKLLTDGKVDADTMLRREVNARDVGLIWELRFLAWFVMMVSIGMTLYSFNILAHVLPLVGGLVGYNNYEMSFFLSLAFTLMTVATAWMSYRPAFAVGLMVLGVSLIIVSTFLKKKTKKQIAKAEAKEEKRELKRIARLEARAQRAVKTPKKRGVAVKEAEKAIPAKLKFLKAPKTEPQAPVVADTPADEPGPVSE